jgi:hypothetical protein
MARQGFSGGYVSLILPKIINISRNGIGVICINMSIRKHKRGVMMYPEIPVSHPAAFEGHVPDSLIDEYVLRTFPDTAVYVEEHVSFCPECSAKLDEAKALLSFFRHAGRSRLMKVTVSTGTMADFPRPRDKPIARAPRRAIKKSAERRRAGFEVSRAVGA